MTAEQLKASVLQMAIEGKLVPQRDDEPAVDIEAVEPEEVPFAIPEKWKWVRLQDIAVEKPRNGYSPKSVEYPTPVKNLMLSATTKGFFRGEFYKYIDEHIPADSYLWLKYGDVLVQRSNSRELVGMACIFDGKEKEYIYPDLMMKFSVKEVCFSEYIVCVLQSPYGREYLKNEAKGSAETMPKISQKTLLKMLIPVPSLSEQERILARLNEILPLIEEYGKAHSALKNVEQALPDQLRASLLQEAIQGKLVPQLDDELAVDIVCEEPDEVPFAIPEKWRWVKLGECVEIVSARRVHQSDWKNSGVPFYRAREIGALSDKGVVQNNLFISHELYKTLSFSGIPEEGDLMVTAVGTLGKCYIVNKNDKFYYKDASVLCFKNKGKFLPQFLRYVMQSAFMKMQIIGASSGTTVGTITIKNANLFRVPLPPLAEQRRIVARLEELLPHVDAIAGLR